MRQHEKTAQPFRPQIRNCFNSFFDAAQELGPDEAISALFPVFLTEQIASRIPVYEGRNSSYKFPIRFLMDVSLY